MIILLVFALLFTAVPALSAPAPLDPSDPEVIQEIGAYFGPGSTGAFRSRHGMVASASAHATFIGVEVLRSGGNAFDAAVAVQLALGVAEPYGSGIGGGLFALGFNSEAGEVFTLDGREETPAEFRIHRFMTKDRSRLIPFRDRITGGNPVGVPGTLAACQMLLRDHGTLSFPEVAAPAIALAEQGFRVSETFAANLAQHWDRLRLFPETAALYGRPDGTPLQAGDLFRNPDMAATLRWIAAEGIDSFYHGELAAEIVSTVRNDSIQPGVLSEDDLRNYQPVYREPVISEFRGYQIVGMGMPSSGGATLALMMNLAGEALGDDSQLPMGKLIDIQNLAFADRDEFMADADFVDVPLEILISPAYARERARLLESSTALETPVAPGLDPDTFRSPLHGRQGGKALESRSTTHFSIVDRERNVVSITTTLEQHFGSGMTVPGRGFQLNNQLTDFSETADAANAPEQGYKTRRTALPPANQTSGGKRPRSSMTPTLVLRDGSPYLVIGSPGGSRIIGVVFNVLFARLVGEEALQEAVNQPRVVARNGVPELETPLFRKTAIVDALKDTGYSPRDGNVMGAVQAIEITPDGWLLGAADPRREGLALGY